MNVFDASHWEYRTQYFYYYSQIRWIETSNYIYLALYWDGVTIHKWYYIQYTSKKCKNEIVLKHKNDTIYNTQVKSENWDRVQLVRMQIKINSYAWLIEK